jgi:hypothetical protein
MLTAREEQILREVARDNTPMQVVNPGGGQGNSGETFHEEGKHLERLIQRNVETPRTTTGMREDGKYLLAGEDEIVRRVGHTMKRGEQLIQWFARVGLGKAQILSMSKSDITKFVEQAERNNLESSPESYGIMPAAALNAVTAPVKERTTRIFPDYAADATY